MKINARIKYNEEYLPTKRHRIPKIREVEETIQVELKEIKKEEAKLAFRVSDYGSFLNENGVSEFDSVQKDIFAIENTLYTKEKDMWGSLDKGEYPLDKKIHDIEVYGEKSGWPFPYGAARTRELVIEKLNEFIDNYITIDGKLYEKCNEPMYMINTFGLGHNHGGTGMFIAYTYNPNISKNNYFNALERDQAILYANKVAEARGDTNDFGTFGDVKNIEVFMPEMVKCNPQLEHGEGDPFMNSLEELISGSGSVMEAGLLVMAGTAHEIKNEKVSLTDKISNAENRKSVVPKESSKEHSKENCL